MAVERLHVRAVVAVRIRHPPVVAVEDDPEQLGGLDDAEGLLEEALGCLVSGDHHHESVDDFRERAAVGQRNHRGRVDDDVIVVVPGLAEYVGETLRLQPLVGVLAAAGRDDGEVESRKRLRHIGEREQGCRDRLREARTSGIQQPELLFDGVTAKIGVDEQDARVGTLGEGAGEIDGGGRFSVADGGTGDRDHAQPRLPVKIPDGMGEYAVLLGLERAGREQADEMLVRLLRPPRGGGADAIVLAPGARSEHGAHRSWPPAKRPMMVGLCWATYWVAFTSRSSVIANDTDSGQKRHRRRRRSPLVTMGGMLARIGTFTSVRRLPTVWKDVSRYSAANTARAAVPMEAASATSSSVDRPGPAGTVDGSAASRSRNSSPW